MSLRKLIGFAVVLISFMPAAFAANSTQGAPPSAEKEGGVEGDPRGAIRTLNDSHPGKKDGSTTTVVPNLGGEGDVPMRKVPEGTTGGATTR